MADNDLAAPIQSGEGPAPRGAPLIGPDYRALQAPAVVNTNLPDNGAAERAAAMGRAFREFGDVSAKVGNQLMSQAGREAGAKAGLDPNFQPKTGLASITAYGSAYDAAAHVSYINGTQAQVENALSTAEQDAAGDPVAFQTRAAAIGEAIVKQAPDMYKPELTNMIALRMQAGMTRTRAQAIQTARSDAYESYTSTTGSRIDTALQTASTLPGDQQAALVQKTIEDNRTQLDALVQARAITPERSAILQNKFQAQMTTAVQDQYTNNTVNHFMDLARAGDVDAADRALHQYITDPANSDADKAAVTKAYMTQADTFTQLQGKLHANDVAAIGQSLVQGKGLPAGQGAYGPDIEPQIHQLYKIGAISPELLHSLMDQSMRNQVNSIHDDSSNQLIDAAIHGGPKLDPEDKTVVKAADTYFRTHVAMSGVQPLSDPWVVGASAFARQTNIIPPSVLSQIRIGLISGNPQQAAQAAAAAERIRAANPQLDPYNKDPRSAAIANEINANTHAGMAPAAAYQTAVQTVDRPEAQAKVIKANYAQIVKQDPNGNGKALQDAMDAQVPGLFAKAPPAPVPLQAEYSRLVSTYYGMTQNIDTARKLAVQQTQTTWGMSQMNGTPELVKYPPEKLGITPQVIRSDVAASVKAAGYAGDPSQVHLTPNSNTDASGGRIWTLTHVDPKTGFPDVLLDQANRPLQYQVPAGPDFAKARQALIEQRIALAREQRDANRKNSADQTMYEQQLADQYLNGNPMQRAQAGR